MAGVTCAATSSSDSCVNAPNLTMHDTGIARYSATELRHLIFDGTRPDGRRLSAAAMPYYAYAAATPADADAVVSYLRTVAPQEQAVPESAPDAHWQPATAISASDLPMPAPGADAAAAQAQERGRYLATLACVACHTPRPLPSDPSATRPIDLARALSGGQPFANGGPFIFSANLTPDPSGLGEWSPSEIAHALQAGVTKAGQALCAPMPVAAFAQLTSADATDIATYLSTIPKIGNAVSRRCAPRPASRAAD